MVYSNNADNKPCSREFLESSKSMINRLKEFDIENIFNTRKNSFEKFLEMSKHSQIKIKNTAILNRQLNNKLLLNSRDSPIMSVLTPINRDIHLVKQVMNLSFDQKGYMQPKTTNQSPRIKNFAC